LELYLTPYIPKPTIVLKNSPAKTPVTAITPRPYFARAVSATKSAKEVPQARTVNPMITLLS